MGKAVENLSPNHYVSGSAGQLRLASKATYPSDLNSLKGSCPCLGSWSQAHGAHLVYQVEGVKQSFTALAAPPPFF